MSNQGRVQPVWPGAIFSLGLLLGGLVTLPAAAVPVEAQLASAAERVMAGGRDLLRTDSLLPLGVLLLLTLGLAWLSLTQRRTLARQRSFLEQGLEQTTELVRVLDGQGRIEYINPALERYSGYAREALAGTPVSVLIEAEAGSATPEQVEQALDRGEWLTGRVALRGRDGTLRHEEWDLRPLPEKRGRTARFLILGRPADTGPTEQQRPHETPQGRALELERLLEATGTGLIATDDQGFVHASNRAARALLAGGGELPPAPGLWKEYFTTLDPRAGYPLLSARDPIRRALRGERVEGEEVEVVTPEERRRLKVTGGPLVPESPDGQGALVALQDITESRGTMDALAASEARFRALTDNLPGAVFEVWEGESGYPCFRFLNDGAKGLFERPSQAIVAEPGVFSSLLDVRDSAAFLEAMRRSARSGQEWNWEGRLRFGQRRVKWINWRATPRPEWGGPVWYGVALNITESREATLELARLRDRLRDLHSSREEVQEAERKAMAREIHDELGSQLTGLKMNAAWLAGRSEEFPAELRERVEAMCGLTDQSIETMRRVAAELRPRVLDDFGIVAALKWRAADFERDSGIPVELTTPEEESVVPAALETTLYRVFQEALTNIAKHSGATRVDAVLEEREGWLTLCIRDNGRGFESASLEDPHHNGIFGMRERVLAHGGEFEINGAPGKGVVLCIHIPLAMGGQRHVEHDSRDDR